MVLKFYTPHVSSFFDDVYFSIIPHEILIESRHPSYIKNPRGRRNQKNRLPTGITPYSHPSQTQPSHIRPRQNQPEVYQPVHRASNV